jgi:capsular polysaccharide biosynthesis protein
VGRSGTIHVPAADACLKEFESPPRDTTGFRRHIPFGRLNPRFWKHAALALSRERFVPAMHRCPGRVAVLNASGSHNFFHWTTEVLPRLQTLLTSGEQADWFVVDGYARWQQESLTAFGVPSERVIQPHATLHLEADELLVPSLNPVQAFQPMADTLAQRLGVGNRGSSTRMIFIERRRSRLPDNGAEFSAWRRQRGFADHRLEALPLASQIALFREASIVLAAHGAGLSHTIHCRPGALVVELMPQGVNRPCYSHLSRIARLRHVVIEAPRRGWHQNMTIPLDTIDQALHRPSHPYQ